MAERATQSERLLNTAYGQFPVSDHQLFVFEQGIIGLPHIKEYALFPYEDSELFILQSCQDEISFILIPAYKVDKILNFPIDEETVELLGIQQPEDVTAFLIVHIVEDKPYVNAKAPILLVPSTNKGCQYVINDVNFAIREPLVMKGQLSC